MKMFHLPRPLLVSLLLSITCLWNAAHAQTPADAQTVKVGAKAPLFQLQSLDGDTISLADYLGKYVVIHLAASW